MQTSTVAFLILSATVALVSANQGFDPRPLQQQIDTCANDGRDGYLTRVHGKQVYRDCGPGTKCRSNGYTIFCDYKPGYQSQGHGKGHGKGTSKHYGQEYSQEDEYSYLQRRGEYSAYQQDGKRHAHKKAKKAKKARKARKHYYGDGHRHNYYGNQGYSNRHYLMRRDEPAPEYVQVDPSLFDESYDQEVDQEALFASLYGPEGEEGYHAALVRRDEQSAYPQTPAYGQHDDGKYDEKKYGEQPAHGQDYGQDYGYGQDYQQDHGYGQDYGHQQPAYGHQQPAYGQQHQQPAYGHQQPAYGHQEPAYKPEPEYGYGQEQPAYQPEPEYGYGQEQPAYGHQEPAYHPEPAYQPKQEYGYGHEEPAYQPEHHGYKDGDFKCNGLYNFFKMDHGKWVDFKCGPGTVCNQTSPKVILCDHAPAHKAGHGDYKEEKQSAYLQKRSSDAALSDPGFSYE